MSDEPLLAIRALSKTFVGTRVLTDVGLDVHSGEVHALVGHNGSGKSTLIKVLAGFHRPDPGSEIELVGTAVGIDDPAASHAAGLRFLHQDLGLIDDLSAVDNLILGRELRTGALRRIRWAAERREVARRLNELGYDFDPQRPVRELSSAQRTGVAIVRALWDIEDARVLIVDEPTASLPRHEVDTLFEAIRRVRAFGLGVVYVSHRLDEIFELADRVTVLRDGRRVGSLPIADLDRQRLIALMVGGEHEAGPRAATSEHGPVMLELRGLCGLEVVDLDLQVRTGEIVGIAGLTGSGREELLSLVFGARQRAGTVLVAGRPVAAAPVAAIKAGIAFVPADRRALGAIVDWTVAENCVLAAPARYLARGRRLDRAAERRELRGWIDRFDVRPRQDDIPFSALSGGNQQKVVLIKWLRREPRVLLLDEPTQGVDIAVKATIHDLARQAASDGAVVVVASSEDAELCDLCDRVVVLADGRIVAELSGDDLTAERLARAQLAGSALQSL